MATYYVINAIHPGYDGMAFGNLVPEIKKSYEDALAHAQDLIVEAETSGTIYDDVKNKIHEYDDEDNSWNVTDVPEITEEDLYDAEEYTSYFISAVEYDI